jgi:hypothetical protein
MALAGKLDKKYTSTGDIAYARLAISAYNTAVKSNKVLLEGERMDGKNKKRMRVVTRLTKRRISKKPGRK